jgi:hypothetical protein
MKIAKQLMSSAEIYPKLKLGVRTVKPDGSYGAVVSTGPQKVKLIKEFIRKGIDRESGKVIEVYKIVVEHEGITKEYRMPIKARETGELHYLVQRLSKVDEGEEIIMEMKKQGPKNYIEVLRADGSPIEVDEEEITDTTHGDEEPADDVEFSDETLDDEEPPE